MLPLCMKDDEKQGEAEGRNRLEIGSGPELRPTDKLNWEALEVYQNGNKCGQKYEQQCYKCG